MYFWSVYIHILMAMFWIGGMIFTAAVLVPASRHKMFENKRGELFKVIGTGFSRISWVIFLLMIISGITALLGMGYSMSDLATSHFWGSGYGNTLLGKLHLFSLVLILSGIHDFWLGPKAARLMDEDPENKMTRRFRKMSSWAGRLNLILGLIIVYYAVSLVRG
jgi:copper resistance protein D